MYFDLSKQYVSSTNLFQSFTLSFKFDISDVSSSAMNILARTGPNGEPIATQPTCEFHYVKFHYQILTVLFCAEY